MHGGQGRVDAAATHRFTEEMTGVEVMKEGVSLRSIVIP
jgi:hypothetical protein